MADDHRTVIQSRQLMPDCSPPGPIVRVILGGHERVANLEPVTKVAAQAIGELLIPVVVGARAAALDEQDLP